MATVVSRSPLLRSLRRNYLRAAGAAALAPALAANSALTALNLSSNEIGGHWDGSEFVSTPEGPKAIADALRVNGSLTSVDLSGNQLTNRGRDMTGIEQLAAALGVNGSLTALDLSHNNLKDGGVSAVCEAIQSNKETKLSSLNFGYNGIGPVGANAVAAMVAATGSLTKME